MIFDWFKNFYSSIIDWLNGTRNIKLNNNQERIDYRTLKLLDLDDDDFFNEPRLLTDKEIKEYNSLSQSTPNFSYKEEIYTKKFFKEL